MRGITVAVSAIAVLSLTPVASANAAEASDPTGIWINDTGRGAIEIKPCGDKLCGNVVWVKSDADAKGCGKQIIGDVVSAGGGHWGNGWIYSPERGRKYNVELTPLANGTLRVTGYAGFRFLSKTMIWTRASSDLQLCGQIEAKAKQPAAAGQPNATTAATADAKSGDSKTTTNDSTPATKPEAASEPKVAAALPPKVKTPPAVTPNAAPPVPAPKNSDQAAKTESAPPPASASKDPAPSQASPKSTEPDDQTASADDGASDLENKLNGLGLGKIFTKTKSGKCKVDLPWVKVTVDCEN
jgi:uncharacterized protein (DUF2147 family)